MRKIDNRPDDVGRQLRQCGIHSQTPRRSVDDPANLTLVSDVSQCLPDAPTVHRLRERYYTAPEIRRMAQAAGMTVRGVYGGTAGNWGLRPIELDEYELMVIAQR